MTFYNTTAETGAQLRDFREKAESQDDRIFAHFKAHDHGAGFTRSELEPVFPLIPIASLVRSLNSLMNAGRIRKTTEKRDGALGRPQYVWKINRTEPEQPDIFARAA